MTNPIRILTGDCRETLKTIPDGTVQTCVTSPPYWGLRDYGHPDQIGQEPTPESFVETMVEAFREVRRCLHESGTLWLNLGDSYSGAGYSNHKNTGGAQRSDGGKQSHLLSSLSGLKPKDLCMIPWRVAMALQADGWWLRSVICWHKKSCMPESVTDRPTNSWEPIFLLAKSSCYFYDAEAVKEPCESGLSDMKKMAEHKQRIAAKHLTTNPGPLNAANPNTNVGNMRGVGDGNGRNQRNVWTLGPEPYSEAHFATFPTEIPRRAILAGTSARGCCPKCYAPWARVMERSKYEPPTGKRNVDKSRGDKTRKLSGADYNEQAQARTVGWQPGCECGEQPIPQTVLDPFGGSGTTGQVALELARHAILCELNPEYTKLIERRTDVTPGLALH